MEFKYNVGIVPQEVVIDPFFTVERTIDLYAGFFGVRKQDRKTDELLKKLHLYDKRKVNVRKLSGGMKRRLLIAKALVHNPKVLILDEPTAGVDVELRDQLWEYVVELNKAGTTILLTTHYLEEAENLCDNIAIINHGKVIAEGSTENILSMTGEKILYITINENINNLASELIEKKAEKVSDHVIKLSYKPETCNIVDIINDVSKFYNIKDISTQEADLETVFRKIVREN